MLVTSVQNIREVLTSVELFQNAGHRTVYFIKYSTMPYNNFYFSTMVIKALYKVNQTTMISQ